MEVILLERVGKLGQMGDVVKVKDGYARNFLLKRNKALRATEENRAKYDGMKAEPRPKTPGQGRTRRLPKIEGRNVIVIRQASESGQLYGSVSVPDIGRTREGRRCAQPPAGAAHAPIRSSASTTFTSLCIEVETM